MFWFGFFLLNLWLKEVVGGGKFILNFIIKFIFFIYFKLERFFVFVFFIMLCFLCLRMLSGWVWVWCEDLYSESRGFLWDFLSKERDGSEGSELGEGGRGFYFVINKILKMEFEVGWIWKCLNWVLSYSCYFICFLLVRLFGRRNGKVIFWLLL